MLSIKNLVVLAVAVTGSVMQRDAAQVMKGLQLINTDTMAITAAVNKYNGGGMLNALPIVRAQNKLKKELDTVTTDAKSVGVVSETEAQATMDFIGNTLEPTIKASLDALVAKKDNFAADGLTKTVMSSMTDLKAMNGKTGAALAMSNPPNLADKAKALQAKIDGDFDNAIAQFS